mmetsp:Transcript_49626/g.91600  ORF Transcript_49626/g.91600 Transcript_49626/m.91600 type:complete len:209 (+) Transcript_49626:169-795(+)
MDFQVGAQHPSEASRGCLNPDLAISPQLPSACPAGSLMPHLQQQHSTKLPFLKVWEQLCRRLKPTCPPRPMLWRCPTTRATIWARDCCSAEGPPQIQMQLRMQHPGSRVSSRCSHCRHYFSAWMNSDDHSTNVQMMELELRCPAKLVDTLHGSALLLASHTAPQLLFQRHLQRHPACRLCILRCLPLPSPSDSFLQVRQPPVPGRQHL